MLLLLAEATAPITLPWTELGLAGGIFAGMFTLLRYLWQATDKSIDKIVESSEKIAEKHDNTIIKIRDAHQSERQEWRDDQRKREERLNQLCENLLQSLHKSNNSVSSDSSE